MSILVDLRPTELRIYWLAGSEGTFYMDLSEGFDSLSNVDFVLRVFDGSDPATAKMVPVNYTISKEGLSVYCTLLSDQPNITTDEPYYFTFTAQGAGELGCLCYGVLYRKGLM